VGHIEIRNVPEDVHRTLKARAAKADLSLSAYLLRAIVARASIPTRDDFTEGTSRREPMRDDLSAPHASRLIDLD
jgi:antitoxin FitA